MSPMPNKLSAVPHDDLVVLLALPTKQALAALTRNHGVTITPASLNAARRRCGVERATPVHPNARGNPEHTAIVRALTSEELWDGGEQRVGLRHRVSAGAVRKERERRWRRGERRPPKVKVEKLPPVKVEEDPDKMDLSRQEKAERAASFAFDPNREVDARYQRWLEREDLAGRRNREGAV